MWKIIFYLAIFKMAIVLPIAIFMGLIITVKKYANYLPDWMNVIILIILTSFLFKRLFGNKRKSVNMNENNLKSAKPVIGRSYYES